MSRGHLLAFDPSSGGRGSNPGYAHYYRGKLKNSGVIVLNENLAAPERLQHFAKELLIVFAHTNFDVLVVERLRGKMVPPQLHWSVGVILTHVNYKKFREIPISTWKRYARQMPGYAKGDEADAIAIGFAAIQER